MKLAIYCNNLAQLDFFRRLSSAFSERKWDVIFWSNRLSVVWEARRNGDEAVLLHGFYQKGSGALADDCERTFEVRQELLSVSAARRCVRRSSAAASRFFQKYMPEQLWLWNGCNLVRQSLVSEGRRLGIQPLFFEVGNFPGKLFVDKEGVNCRSWYARKRHELIGGSVDLDAFNRWKASYLELKRQQHTVPQARMAHRFNLGFAYDLIGFWLLGAITSDPPRPFWRIFDFVQRRLRQISLDTFDPEKEPGFLFFPLQVSTDSQVLWNSDISQTDALMKASEIAKNEGRVLVVKPHPAEPHWKAIREILQLKSCLNFKLVGGNTFDLLQHCSRVITLNSTVGLEAMLLGKPVETFGKAHYAGFDDSDLARYLQQYLLDIDFFSNAPISESQLEGILARVNM